MTKVPDDNLILRYLEGNCTYQEEKQLEEWLTKDPSNADRFEDFVVENSRSVAIDKNQIRMKLFRKINETPDHAAGAAPLSETHLSYPGIIHKRERAQWFIAAAVIIIIFTTGILTYLSQANDPELQEPEMVEHTVPAGTTATITLSDGSTVWLNAESTLRFPENLGMDSDIREVFLEGEAFFEVTKNDEKPFILYSGQLETTVLGTAFNVKAYPDEDLMQIAVSEGKVMVKQRYTEISSKPVFLESDEWATYSHTSKELKKEQGDIREMIAWKDGVLLFHDKTVAKAVRMLERWYNTKIVVEEEIVKNCRIHGEYKDRSLETVLKMMEFTLDVNYTFTDEGVIISGGMCQ